MLTTELSAELQLLLGASVVHRRILGNTLVLYFFGEPGDKTTVSISLDPTWRYEHSTKIVMGTSDFPWDDTKPDYKTVFNEVCDQLDPVVGSKLLSFSFGAYPCDLSLQFSGEQTIRTFANSGLDEKAWAIYYTPRDTVITISSRGIKSYKFPVKKRNA